MKLELETLRFPDAEKPVNPEQPGIGNAVARAFGKLQPGECVFVPGARRSSSALAAHYVAVSREGKLKSKKAVKDGIDGYYFIFVKD